MVGRLKHSGVYYWTVDGANDILPCPAACSAAMCEDFWATGPRTPAVNRQIHGVLLVCHESAEGSEGSPADMLRKGWRPQAVVQAEAPNHPLLLRTRGAVIRELGKGGARPYQVRIVESNAKGPLLTSRNIF